MFCGNCGKKLNDDAMFCSECGSRINQPIASQSDVGVEIPSGVSQPLGMKKPLGKLPIIIGVGASVAVIAVSVLAASFGGKDVKDEVKEDRKVSNTSSKAIKEELPELANTVEEVVSEIAAEKTEPVEQLHPYFTINYSTIEKIVRRVYDYYEENELGSMWGFAKSEGLTNSDGTLKSNLLLKSEASLNRIKFPSPRDLSVLTTRGKEVNVTLVEMNFPDSANFTGKHDEGIIVSALFDVQGDSRTRRIWVDFQFYSDSSAVSPSHWLYDAGDDLNEYKGLKYRYDNRFNKIELSDSYKKYAAAIKAGRIMQGDAYDVRDVNGDSIPELIVSGSLYLPFDSYNDEYLDCIRRKNSTAIYTISSWDNSIYTLCWSVGIVKFNGNMIAGISEEDCVNGENVYKQVRIDVRDFSNNRLFSYGNPCYESSLGNGGFCYINDESVGDMDLDAALAKAEEIFGQPLEYQDVSAYPYKNMTGLLDFLENGGEDPYKDLQGWKKAYVSGLYDGTIFTSEYTRCGLDDINSDGIPELIVNDDGRTTSIYTFANNKVEGLLVEDGLPSIEGSDLVFFSHYSAAVYRLTSGKEPVFYAEIDFDSGLYQYNGREYDYDEIVAEMAKVGIDGSSTSCYEPPCSLAEIKNAIINY